MDIAKDCLTATGYPSGPGAHKVGKDVFLSVGLQPAQPAGTCSNQDEAARGLGTWQD